MLMVLSGFMVLTLSFSACSDVSVLLNLSCWVEMGINKIHFPFINYFIVTT